MWKMIVEEEIILRKVNLLIPGGNKGHAYLNKPAA